MQKDDAISRKVAIDKFTVASNQDGAYGYLDTKSAVGLLNDLPSVQPEQWWIPVTERLPDKKGKYLCTVRYAVPPYHMFHPELDTYVDEISIQEFKEAEDGNVAFIDSVVSWMPLPEPYGGESDE